MTQKTIWRTYFWNFYNVGSGLAKWVKKVCYTSLGEHGKEPPEEVWRVTFGDKAVDVLKEAGLFEKVLNKEDYSEEEVVSTLRSYAEEVPNVVIAFPYYSTTHTFYRKVSHQAFWGEVCVHATF
jgi:aminopeptidase